MSGSLTNHYNHGQQVHKGEKRQLEHERVQKVWDGQWENVGNQRHDCDEEWIGVFPHAQQNEEAAEADEVAIVNETVVEERIFDAEIHGDHADHLIRRQSGRGIKETND